MLIPTFYLLHRYAVVQPDQGDLIRHMFVPDFQASNWNSKVVLQAVGVVGAVIMPHNFYLHSGGEFSWNSAISSFTVHNITPLITYATRYKFYGGGQNNNITCERFWFRPALVDARVEIYWEKIVISDAITRTVNLEMELLFLKLAKYILWRVFRKRTLLILETVTDHRLILSAICHRFFYHHFKIVR